MQDSLRQLLQRADAWAPIIDQPVDVAALHDRRARRRALRRAGASSAAVLAIAVVALIFNWHPRHDAAIRNQIAALSNEISLHEQTVTALSSPTPHVSEDQPDAHDIQLQRDRAALIMIYQANQHVSDQRMDLAINGYQRTIDLFPQTRWAQVARQRLRELQM